MTQTMVPTGMGCSVGSTNLSLGDVLPLELKINLDISDLILVFFTQFLPRYVKALVKRENDLQGQSELARASAYHISASNRGKLHTFSSTENVTILVSPSSEIETSLGSNLRETLILPSLVVTRVQ